MEKDLWKRRLGIPIPTASTPVTNLYTVYTTTCEQTGGECFSTDPLLESSQDRGTNRPHQIYHGSTLDDEHHDDKHDDIHDDVHDQNLNDNTARGHLRLYL